MLKPYVLYFKAKQDPSSKSSLVLIQDTPVEVRSKRVSRSYPAPSKIGSWHQGSVIAMVTIIQPPLINLKYVVEYVPMKYIHTYSSFLKGHFMVNLSKKVLRNRQVVICNLLTKKTCYLTQFRFSLDLSVRTW